MIQIVSMSLEHCKEVAQLAAKYLPEHWSYEGVCDVLKYNHNVYYVAIDDATKFVIGFAGIMVVGEDAELLNIAVEKAYQGKGIAVDLLRHLDEAACVQQAQRMLLEVRKSNQRAIDVYMHNGYQLIGTRKNYYVSPVEDALIMEKRYI